MEIRFSRYRLTPKKRVNRLSSMEPKEGVFLSAEVDGKSVFADYFPHMPLGDDSVDLFLGTFKDQKTEYQKKILKLLECDSRYQNFPAKKFRNHQLWAGSEPIVSPVVKYKMLHMHDRVFHEALRRGVRVRLDANAMFSKATVQEFLGELNSEWFPLMDYVEDPLSETDWSSFPLKRARDFIQGTPYDLYIYKPNCEFRPEFPSLIYSAYLGSALGNWHTYCEMVEGGNLSIVQGIIGTGFYEEVKDFYTGDFENGFTPDLGLIKELYRDLHQREWKVLCSV